MAVDVTNLFKATVKSVKSRNKAIGENAVNDKQNILSRSRQKGDFESKAKEVITNITQLRDFLLSHRKEYINSGSHLSSEASKMTDSERDQIDNDAQNIIRTCQESIGILRLDLSSHRVHPQVKEHRQIVIFLMNEYLKAVCKIYSEQKAIRVKRAVDRKNISKLKPETSNSPVNNVDLSSLIKKSTDEKGSGDTDKSSNAQKSIRPEFDHENSLLPEDEISPEESQMFEEENKALYDEMNSMSHEVKQIEGKVIEIAKLQEIFAEKVLEQEHEIDHIASTTVGTTENIIDANEEIREAIKKKAEFRVWILFFLVMCALSLLFLDWYNG
ncbi:hypothetical protein LOTGIDRAFT_117319 [Lottia gigantea]|uniref:Syntaxin-18 n=1 Tax=Lottia gigantea TaxID=225164 RepID=V4ADT1_LOTGI|nr:hypothetical protein LOTGIDRAFT_117319 [Lottia gigantea]ESO95012.1 hypothetical protein LOTGIDRAFT_117319 [Lottia gigantea]